MKKNKNESTKDQAVAAAAANENTPVSISPGVYFGGLGCLAFAVTMTVLLVLDHFGAMSLPGCSEGGGCAELTKGKWGTVPGLGFPISFVGLAYFTGLLIAWAVSRGGIPTALKNLVRVGVLGSTMFLIVMLVEWHFCQYCFFTHLANFAFWGLIEFGRPNLSSSLRPIGVVAGVFVLMCGGLYATDRSHQEQVTRNLNKDADKSVKEIIESSEGRAGNNANADSAPTNTTNEVPVVEKRPPFTGRYRYGPEVAPVRILMYTDYQCPDCSAVESVARNILETHDNVSLSIKNFPMDMSCNPKMSKTLHPNACWAARAAETAGMLYGNEGFWKMHHWLFDRRGSFTDVELRAGLAELGFEPEQFISTMMSQITLDLVQSDVNEAAEIAIFFTPMIFINGIHLRGVFEPNADKLRQSVETLLAKNLPALSADHDIKPTALETVIGDWKEEYPRALPPDKHPWLRGPGDARVKIVMWADYQEKWTPSADRAIVNWMADKPDVSYSFRHFPFDQTCNKVVTRTAHPMACLASKSAEAAGLLGGVDAYWQMHDWLMTHQGEFNSQTVTHFASQIGLNLAEFTEALNNAEVTAAIDEDCRAAKSSLESTYTLLYQGGIPTIFINGRAVPRWRLDTNVVIGKILDEAYINPNPGR